MIFSDKKILKEIRELRAQHDNLMYLVKALAKEAGYLVNIYRSEKGGAMVAVVKQNDNHVEFHSVE